MTKNRVHEEAIKQRERAYAPYSHFPVGAIIEMNDGTLIRGCNVENASYPLTNCGERTAMFSMVAQGLSGKDVKQLVIAVDTDDLDTATPCGACRQVMAELLPKETPVVVINGKDERTYTVEELLPYAFKL